ncbi:MAG TPA: 5-oxoprolinase subunit PxpB [Chloroflexia bacterium]|jgi:KipI family sensor histidine kinase inhibitor
MEDKNEVFSPRIEQLGEAALLVRLGNGISESVNNRVLALDEALRLRDVQGIFEQVPAYSTLLVTFDPAVVPEAYLREQIASIVSAGLPPIYAGSRSHTIPVQYGGEAGPDLDELAAAHKIKPADVVRQHTGRGYRVYFLGFMPGFAYMGSLARRIATPRLDTPRVRVPAGSVGIANAQTGVYPFASPGGWRIIGRTGRRLWDSNRIEPSLFAPGDTVTFAESKAEAEQDAVQPAIPPSERPAIRVVEPGAFTTIQDMGRPGYAHLGLCRGGAFDADAAVRANALVGNPAGAAVLEITWSGPTLLAMQNITIAIDGADFGCRVEGAAVPPGLSWLVRSGATIRFSQSSPSRGGARTYLAVAGGFEVPRVLGSRATYLPAGMGGYYGRALKAGDLLDMGQDAAYAGSVAGRYWLGDTGATPTGGVVLRFVRYRGAGVPSARVFEAFIDATWVMSGQSDRMGMRLRRADGNSMASGGREMVSFGVVRGAIQLPPDGNPVVLNVDHQTTGGYPLLGVVAQADWHLLAQLRPGQQLRFEEIGVEEARTALAKSRRDLQRGRDDLTLRR